MLPQSPMCRALPSEKVGGGVESHGRRVANECVFSANENGKERKERGEGEKKKEVMA